MRTYIQYCFFSHLLPSPYYENPTDEAPPALAPAPVGGAERPEAGTTESSSSMAVVGGGGGGGMGMRRELSYPDIAGMSLSCSPSTATAASASSSIRPRRRSGGGGGGSGSSSSSSTGLASMASPQHQPLPPAGLGQQAQILPSPFMPSPSATAAAAAAASAAAASASPALSSPPQGAAGGRGAAITQEERRQLRCVRACVPGRRPAHAICHPHTSIQSHSFRCRFTSHQPRHTNTSNQPTIHTTTPGWPRTARGAGCVACGRGT